MSKKVVKSIVDGIGTYLVNQDSDVFEGELSERQLLTTFLAHACALDKK